MIRRLTEEDIEKQKFAPSVSEKHRGDASVSDKQKTTTTPVTPASVSDATLSIDSKSYCYKTLAVSPNNKTCAVTDGANALFLYDIATGKEIDSKIALGGIEEPRVSTYSPDGKFLLVGGYKGSIRCWAVNDIGEIDPLGDFVGHTGCIMALAVMPDGKTLISSDEDKQVKVWNVADRLEKFTIPNIYDEVIEIGVSPDGKSGLLLATTSNLTVFNLSDGKVLDSKRVVDIHYGGIAAISPDGK